MANTKSAIKRARQTGRRTLRNKAVVTRVKTLLKKARAALASGDKAAAQAGVRELSSALDKAVKKGPVARNKANRHKGELNRKLAALA